MYYHPGIMTPIPYPSTKQECKELVDHWKEEYRKTGSNESLEKYKNYLDLYNKNYTDDWGQ